jgi:hypothetical protein
MRGGRKGIIIATRVEQPRHLGEDRGMLRSAERVSNPKMSTAALSLRRGAYDAVERRRLNSDYS